MPREVRATEFVEVVRKVMEAAGVIMSTLSVKFCPLNDRSTLSHFGRYGRSDCPRPGRANRFHRWRNRCHIPLRSWMTRPGPCHTSTAAAGLFSNSLPAARTASASDPHSTE